MTRSRPLACGLLAALTLAGCPSPGAQPPAGPTPPANMVGAGSGVITHNGGAILPTGANGMATPMPDARLPGPDDATGGPPKLGSSTLPPLDPTSPGALLAKRLAEGTEDERGLSDYGLVLDNGSGLVAAGGGNLVAAGGGNMVAAGGGNMVAAGGGNMVAAGGLNYRAPVFGLLATDDDDAREGPLLAPAVAVLADPALGQALTSRRAKLGALAEARLAKRGDRAALVAAIQGAKPKANADGTRTYQFTTKLPWRGFQRRTFFFAVVGAKNQLVHSYMAYLKPRPNKDQPFHQVWREAVVRADGSTLVRYFQSQLTQAGMRRVVTWQKVVAADGAVTGSGTIRWRKPGTKQVTREVPLAFGGREDGTETLTAGESLTGPRAVLALAPDAEPTATVETGGAKQAVDLAAVAEELVVADPEAPEAAD